MSRLALVCLVLAGGCSLLFDPRGIVPHPDDASVTPADLHAPVDDLAPPRDLTALPDLSADLLQVDSQPPPDLLPVDLRPCTPPLFVGFFDGGSPDPLDCNGCGCTLDRFDNNAATALKLSHALSPGWSEQNDGGLTMVAFGAAVNTGDLYYSAGHAYLDGDFDLQLDYQVQHWPIGGNLLLYAIGPDVDGGVPFNPFAYAQLYEPGADGVSHLRLNSDDRYLDTLSSTLTGTMRLQRTGSTLCVSVVGHEEQCHSGTSSARVYVQIYGLTNSAACGTACDFRVRVANLRLAHGVVVSTP